MTSANVQYLPDGHVIDLDTEMGLIRRLHDQKPWRRDIHELACTQKGSHVFIKHSEDTGLYWFSHFKGDLCNVYHGSDETDEHKRQKEYWCRAATDDGLSVVTELPISGGQRKIAQLDVAITGGSVATDIEIQRFKITSKWLKTRDTRYRNAGYLPVWFNDGGPRPDWLYPVLAMGCNAAPWAEYLPQRRSVTATGLRVVDAVKCVVGAFQTCPNGHYRPCGKYHPNLTPWNGLTVDAVAALVPAGEAVPLKTANGIFLVPLCSVAKYEELTSGTSTDAERIAREPAEYREGLAQHDCLSPTQIPMVGSKQRQAAQDGLLDLDCSRTRLMERMSYWSGSGIPLQPQPPAAMSQAVPAKGLDWRKATVAPVTAPCVICGKPAFLRAPDIGVPCHKICAEA